MNSIVSVRLAFPGKKIETYEIGGNPTVGGLLAAAGLSYVNGCATRNHILVNEFTQLYDGELVVYATPTKGNLFEVKVIIVGGAIVSVPAEDGMTIGQALAQLTDENKKRIYDSNGKLKYELRIGDSLQLSENYVLNSNPSGVVRLILATQTKGN